VHRVVHPQERAVVQPAEPAAAQAVAPRAVGSNQLLEIGVVTPVATPHRGGLSAM
jgi:hypothetical protein